MRGKRNESGREVGAAGGDKTSRLEGKSLKRRIEIRFIDFRSHSPFFSGRSRQGESDGGTEGSKKATKRVLSVKRVAVGQDREERDGYKS